MTHAEHRIQSAFYRWSVYARCEHTELRLLYAVPNGGARNAVTGAMLKAEGVRRGVPDMGLPVARGGFLSLWLEFKTESGALSPEQRVWHEWLRGEGHRVEVVRSVEEAIAVVKEYLQLTGGDSQRPSGVPRATGRPPKGPRVTPRARNFEMEGK